MNEDLLFFAPVYKTPLWGGTRMKTAYGYDIPSETTGECWAVSAHENGDCVCTTGKFKGCRLSELWKTEPELFGNLSYDRFPLLLKIIDAKTDLSISVHPSDEYAYTHENGSYGKAECWYILDCEPGAKLVVGHNATSKEELCNYIDEGKFDELVREVEVRPGDFIHISPGTLHSINGGIMLLEVQQSSDITYRVYDYNRLQNGKPRELHLDKAKETISIEKADVMPICTSNLPGCTNLVSCKYFNVDKINVDKTFTIGKSDSFRLISCVRGEGYAGDVKIHAGDHFLLPCSVESLTFCGNITLICAEAN